jgi:hypothetical protein
MFIEFEKYEMIQYIIYFTIYFKLHLVNKSAV